MELYHGTTVLNLEQITPHYDGHEKQPYVFATPNFASALRYITTEKGNLYFGIVLVSFILLTIAAVGLRHKTGNDESKK